MEGLTVDASNVVIGLEATTKEDVLSQLADLMHDN
ncbi:MAG: PTS sugar transporter subunit IIA, partial [Staphylococcus equorum]|nr:PTS sugar transporter subunit IIA [Staphylococcus equorum]